MNFHEYQAKQLFADYGIAVPAGRIARTSEEAVEAFLPDLSLWRAYAPDFYNALGKLGAAAGYYDGNGHYARASFAGQNLFQVNSSDVLEPISRSQQYAPFGSSAPVRQPCPGGATQRAADNSNPFIDPPWTPQTYSYVPAVLN